jgi:hypothetical protein
MKTQISALEMTRRIRDTNYQRTLGMTHEQRLAFYREHAMAMRAKAKTLLQNLPAAQPGVQPARVLLRST